MLTMGLSTWWDYTSLFRHKEMFVNLHVLSSSYKNQHIKMKSWVRNNSVGRSNVFYSNINSTYEGLSWSYWSFRMDVITICDHNMWSQITKITCDHSQYLKDYLKYFTIWKGAISIHYQVTQDIQNQYLSLASCFNPFWEISLILDARLKSECTFTFTPGIKIEAFLRNWFICDANLKYHFHQRNCIISYIGRLQSKLQA